MPYYECVSTPRSSFGRLPLSPNSSCGVVTVAGFRLGQFSVLYPNLPQWKHIRCRPSYSIGESFPMTIILDCRGLLRSNSTQILAYLPRATSSVTMSIRIILPIVFPSLISYASLNISRWSLRTLTQTSIVCTLFSDR